MSPAPARLQRLFDHAGDDVEAILVVNDPPDATFQWATGLHGGGTFEGSAVVLRPGEGPQVFVPPLEETTARRGLGEVVVFRGAGGLKDALAEVLGGLGTVGIDHTKVTLARHRSLKDALPGVTFENVHDAIHDARLVKDPEEVAAIRDACRLTDRLADEMETYVTGADTEAELAADLVRAIRARGATTSFAPIVAGGPGSAEPHYAPQTVPLKDGPLLVDMGAKLAGYCSDITRTYHIGEPSNEFMDMYEVCDTALEAALDTVAPGVEGGQVHKAAARIIDDSPFKGRFIHTVGHSLGVEVHDGGRLHPSHELELQEGMVFTVEPGIYVPQVAGVRLEEDVVVTASGCETLTRADRSLRIL